MKSKLSFSLIVVLFLFNSVFAQQIIVGKVTEIVDGRTFIIETPEGIKLLIQLQQIEPPGSEFPLSKIVKDHLQKLILNKTVEFEIRAVDHNRNIGRVLVDNVDISKQMLRDGAAWYSLPDSESHNLKERGEYQKMEAVAKEEKRGVWEDASVKPSWQILAEQNEQQRVADEQASQKEDSQRALKRQQDREKANANVQMWASVPEAETKAANSTDSMFDPNGNLTVDYDEFTDKGFVSTPMILLQTTGSKTLFGVQYHFSGNKPVKGGNTFVFALAGVDYDDEVIFLTDKLERFNLGTGKRPSRKSAGLYYFTDRPTLLKLVNSKQVFVKIGVTKAIIEPAFLNAISRLLEATQ